MDKLVIDQIIEAIETNPNSNVVELVNSFRVIALDQIEHAFFVGESKLCEEGKVSSSLDYLKKHFNIN